MRALLVLAIVVVLFAVIGWVSFDTSGDRPSATIETQKIEQDMDQLSESASEAGDAVERSVDDASR